MTEETQKQTEQEVQEQPAVAKAPEQKSESGKVAVILVRGLIGMRTPVKDTLKMMRLNRKNHCVVLDKNQLNLGRIKKVKDYITWGDIDKKTYKELVEKKGEEYLGPEEDSRGKISYAKRFFIHEGKKYKKYFRLNPPKKGFGRKGIKMPFRFGGGLGDRKEKINDLLRRML